MNIHFLYRKGSLYLLLALFLSSCEEPYSPEVLEASNNFLVVSGFINSNGPTTIKLSRTQNLSDNSAPAFVTDAEVKVEADNGAAFLLQETSDGTYTSGTLPINVNQQYRLTININGKRYASDYVAVKQTPAIDEVSWQLVDDKVLFQVTTHDAQNDTRYYRWEFEETWEYNAYFFSVIEFVDGELVTRPEENNIYLCWRNNNSSNINISNTIKLSQDVVSKFPLYSIPLNSEKFARKYSVLVKQYAQTKESYQYWESLKKNTESIGTLFDPLPTQLTGNIRNTTDPSEPVIGYIHVSSVSEKRIFLKQTELPYVYRAPSVSCTLDTVAVEEVPEYFSGGSNLPVGPIYTESGTLIGYSGAWRSCVDCRIFGTTTRPSYWQ
ncbi:DUF4249 domain-containing protein [Rufibacter roseus]|uniref:DUF4249 domain-containing protein n=1 Tax=Rufibacter roseus TaxID=1567108 RepID=A0ABW2DRM9_9BACT|nr:DUF4249 domain-containing protein [Rufibacter roseus]